MHDNSKLSRDGNRGTLEAQQERGDVVHILIAVELQRNALYAAFLCKGDNSSQ